MFEPAPDPPLAEQSMTTAALAVLEFARDEAIALNHHYAGTEHLLLGLMRGPNSRAARALTRETDLESAREQVRKLVGLGQEVPRRPSDDAMRKPRTPPCPS